MSAIADQDVLATIESSNRFLIQQLFKPIGNEYRISIPAPGSTEEGEPVLFVKQKKLKIKEDIRFRVSPDDDAHLFMIKSKSVFEFRGRHEVLDANDQVIGLLEKDFARSLISSHWHVRDANGDELFDAREANMLIALVRRFAGFVSDALDLLQWLPFNFVLLKRRGSRNLQARAREAPRPLRLRAWPTAARRRPPARARLCGRARRAARPLDRSHLVGARAHSLRRCVTTRQRVYHRHAVTFGGLDTRLQAGRFELTKER